MGAMWVSMDDSDPRYKTMYANHKQMVETVLGLGVRLGFGLQLTLSKRSSRSARRCKPYPTPTTTPSPIPNQVREKELTHLRAGLLTTVVKWGKVALRP